MNCLFLKPLTDDEISLLLDGHANDDLIQHVAQCPACAQRLETARLIEISMKAKLFRADCPAPQTLGDYHAGLLTPDDRKMIAAHLNLCASCRSELQTLIDFLAADLDETVPLPEVPPNNIIRPPTTYFQAATPLRKVRGSDKRQLRATVNGVQLFFDLQRSPKGIALEGLLVPQEKKEMSVWVGSLVEIRTVNELLSVCYIDDMGTFRCELIPEGMVYVRITSVGGRSIVVSDLEIKM
jgi:hypothetical protein